MNLTHYEFSNAVGAFFEMPTQEARGLLPSHLEPLEVQHTRSVLALTVFHFTESMVGSYDEVVLSILVPPRVESGAPLPKAAFFPFVVATNTKESREHAIERWHLPHYMSDVEIEQIESDESMDVKIRDGEAPILDLTITKHEFEPVRHLYNSFMVNDDQRYKVNIYMEGPHSEHEEETGSLRLYDHEMTEGITVSEVSSWPFREQWLKDGVQTFEELETF